MPSDWRAQRSALIVYYLLFWGLTVASLGLTSAAAAQTEKSVTDDPKTAELERLLEYTARFHADWGQSRSPLTQFKRRALYHRELVMDDITNRILQYYRRLGAAQPRSDADSSKDPPAESGAGATANTLSLKDVAGKTIAASESHPHQFHVLRCADAPTIGHVDCEVDYQCMCQTEQIYNAIPADTVPLAYPARPVESASALIERIRDIPAGRLYDCYSVTNHHEGFQKQTRCRFLSVLTSDADADIIRSIASNTRIPALRKGLVSELAIESALRVTERDRRPL